MNSLQQFRVLTQEAGRPADFQVTITAPSGNRVKAHVVPTHEGYLVNFTPTELGEYLLAISFGGEPITNQPYRLTCVHGSDPEKVRASGPGLSHGVVNKPAEFVIDTRGAGQGNLGVTVEGPCEAAINCRDNGDGTCSVAYLPTEIGDYGINITFNEKHIPGSPFQAIVVKDVDVSRIKVTGTGIQPNGTVFVVCFNRCSRRFCFPINRDFIFFSFSITIFLIVHGMYRHLILKRHIMHALWYFFSLRAREGI